ncbi:MAG: bifunctional adenosylcobinamide kinase/adenosylcobinamide-phosphate guanylyltransferase [Coriobacteriia bacterium]|nr:bifunctional adenosylcobinamide kinase/adenosylcobinamide-phosphate guanylyltransferase [Coriobacteriia bacterium]
MLAVVTGPVRSGKSRVALDLALQTEREIVIAVGGRADDEEMARRIAAHQAGRPAHIRVLEAGDDPGWVTSVPADACLLVDCLGTLLGRGLADLVPVDVVLASAAVERSADVRADALVSALLARGADTIVVGNEVGWGVVPATPLGRLFRDVMGRSLRTLIDSADVAVAMIAGRCVDLTSLPREVRWKM